MRYIEKGCEPASFTKWKGLANDNWQPTYGDFRNPEKRDVYEALIREQSGLCCYCESSLETDNYHIEHLNPQAARVGDDVDYENFLCSCLKKTGKGAALHCGQKRGDKVLLVNPTQKDCQSHFIYRGDGKIEGKSEDAKSVVSILGLGIPKLNDLRKGVLEAIDDPDLSLDEFKSFLKNYVEKKDTMAPYVSAVECVYGDFL